MTYVPLHLHDSFSVLDGYSTPAEYMSRAVELGMTHIAQTNHGTNAGHREFQREAEKAGIIPILGQEMYWTADRFDRTSKAKRQDGDSVYNHLTVLATGAEGLRNLDALSTKAWTEGFYYAGRIDTEILEEYSDGLIVLSGCMSGIVARHIMAGEHDKAKDMALHFKRIFGERYFIEVMSDNDKSLNLGLMQLAEDIGVRPVVTPDCHHARREDLWAQEAFLILSTNPKLNKDFEFSKSQQMDIMERFNYLYPERTMTFEKLGLHLRSAEEHLELLSKQGIGQEVLDNTWVVAHMISEYPYHQGLSLLPTPDKTIDDLDAELKRLAFEGLDKRGFAGNQEYIDRLNHELEVIKGKNFSNYFLILGDAIAWAREQGIFIGPGRGSGVSSLVNYCLYITNVDPMKYNLLFMRFVDPSRDEYPDVDVDIEIKRRWEVKDYLIKKYGDVSNIMTLGYFGGKSAIKSAASLLKVPVGETNKITKLLADDAEYSALDMYEHADWTREYRAKYPEILKVARALDGRLRSTGIHPGGVVLSNTAISNYVPLETRNDPQDTARGRIPVMAVDMNEAANIGFIKYDLLGLNTLTIVKEVLESVKQRTGRDIDPYTIPLDDGGVYEMLSRGETLGCFQVEAPAYTKLLTNMGGVSNFDELAASNALVRPGAADSEVGDTFIRGKNNGEYEFIHECTRSFTSDTYSAILFQEQQMLLCTELAGMSMGEANQVRGAISKKIPEKLALHKDDFIEGASRKISRAKAERVWKDLEASGNYSFNKSHAVGYSIVSYWTAWLKLHYPAEFMRAVLNNVSGQDERIKTMLYLIEAKRLGIDIYLPHVSRSGVKCEIEGVGIRLGLSMIKFVSERVATKIIDRGPYDSYAQLLEMSQTKFSGVNARALEHLNLVGAAAFDDNPKNGTERDNLYEVMGIPAFDARSLPPELSGGIRDVDEYSESGSFVVCAMVYNIKVGSHWRLAEYVDGTGATGSFVNTKVSVEKGNMYVMVISDNSIVEAHKVQDVIDGNAGAVGRWIHADSLALKDNEYRCISYSERKSGTNDIGSAVFTDKNKNLIGVGVYANTIASARIMCATGTKVNLRLRENRRGKLVLDSIKRAA